MPRNKLPRIIKYSTPKERKKEPGKAGEENSSCVRMEWVNNSPTPW